MALYITDNNGVLHKIADVSSNIEVDAELSAESENPVQNKVVENALRGKVSIENVSNPNLLINGDFRVNQRGQASYTENGVYTLDRWRKWFDGSLNVYDDNIELINTGSVEGIIQQPLDPQDTKKLNITLTLSAMISIDNGNTYQIYSVSGNPIADGITKYLDIENTSAISFGYDTDNSRLFINIYVFAGKSVKIKYVKLEVGSVATPLNQRLYAEELALCQRYYQITSIISSLWQADSTTSLTGIIQFKGNMRTTPTIEQTNLMTVLGINENTSFKQTSSYWGAGMISLAEAIKIVVGGFTGLTKGNIYQPYLDASMARFVLDAEIY